MPNRFDLFKDMNDLSINTNHEGRPRDAKIFLSVHALLLPDPIFLGDRVIGVGKEREVQMELFRKLRDRGGFIRADAKNDDMGLVVVRQRVAKPARFLCATRRVRTRIKI